MHGVRHDEPAPDIPGARRQPRHRLIPAGAGGTEDGGSGPGQGGADRRAPRRPHIGRARGMLLPAEQHAEPQARGGGSWVPLPAARESDSTLEHVEPRPRSPRGAEASPEDRWRTQRWRDALIAHECVCVVEVGPSKCAMRCRDRGDSRLLHLGALAHLLLRRCHISEVKWTPSPGISLESEARPQACSPAGTSTRPQLVSKLGPEPNHDSRNSIPNSKLGTRSAVFGVARPPATPLYGPGWDTGAGLPWSWSLL